MIDVTIPLLLYHSHLLLLLHPCCLPLFNSLSSLSSSFSIPLVFLSLFFFSLLRSPSPEPIYTSDGKRFNTREVRVRKRLEDERHDYIQAALMINPDYKPPMDYK